MFMDTNNNNNNNNNNINNSGLSCQLGDLSNSVMNDMSGLGGMAMSTHNPNIPLTPSSSDPSSSPNKLSNDGFQFTTIKHSTPIKLEDNQQSNAHVNNPILANNLNNNIALHSQNMDGRYNSNNNNNNNITNGYDCSALLSPSTSSSTLFFSSRNNIDTLFSDQSFDVQRAGNAFVETSNGYGNVTAGSTSPSRASYSPESLKSSDMQHYVTNPELLNTNTEVFIDWDAQRKLRLEQAQLEKRFQLEKFQEEQRLQQQQDQYYMQQQQQQIQLKLQQQQQEQLHLNALNQSSKFCNFAGGCENIDYNALATSVAAAAAGAADQQQQSVFSSNLEEKFNGMQRAQRLTTIKVQRQRELGARAVAAVEHMVENSAGLAEAVSTSADIRERDMQLEHAAKFHRSSAARQDARCYWTGQLPSRDVRNIVYSPKVFLGGIPWDVNEQSLINVFRPFGPIKIEWPGKEQHIAQPKGYVYIIFESDKQVKALLEVCTQQRDESDSTPNYYFKLSSRRIKAKDVEVIPWMLSDSNYAKAPVQHLDGRKTVFVGALHGKLNADGLALIMDQLFGNVLYAGIDTDKYKYPIGSGRVTFSTRASFIKAVLAAFVEIRTTKFIKKVQIDPYLEDALCSLCGVHHGPYFCREMDCFKYFCHTCWTLHHDSQISLQFRMHKPLSRNSKSQHLLGFDATSNMSLCSSSACNTANVRNSFDRRSHYQPHQYNQQTLRNFHLPQPQHAFALSKYLRQAQVGGSISAMGGGQQQSPPQMALSAWLSGHR